MEKKRLKFNPVDAVIVLVIAIAIGVVGIKFFSGEGSAEAMVQYRISFFCEDVPTYAAELIKEGDSVTDDDKKEELGVVERVSLGPSKTYATTADGEMKLAPKEDANSVEVVALVQAKEFQHGIAVGSARYGVGHSLTLRVGKTKIFGRVSGLEKISE
ncbi:MAG: DUF4330 domain-containing protein [Clostridia bacterium]|nr:DUF4330 domain-containing protein [Clostridia bacterium]